MSPCKPRLVNQHHSGTSSSFKCERTDIEQIGTAGSRGKEDTNCRSIHNMLDTSHDHFEGFELLEATISFFVLDRVEIPSKHHRVIKST